MKLSRAGRSRASGFTIVETMIVLAVAGIILLIVLEAIPALERSSRNNQRRQDVQTILEAVSHYELNNSGNIPECGYGGAAQADCIGTATNQNQLGNLSLTYYVDGDIVVCPSDLGKTSNGCNTPDPTRGQYTAVTDIEKVQVVNHARCNSNSGTAATDNGASYSDIVALYAIESGSSGSSAQCQQL